MSAFENYEKDEIYDNIKNFISQKKKDQPSISMSEIMKELMEVISMGIEHGINRVEETP